MLTYRTEAREVHSLLGTGAGCGPALIKKSYTSQKFYKFLESEKDPSHLFTDESV